LSYALISFVKKFDELLLIQIMSGDSQTRKKITVGRALLSIHYEEISH